MRFRPRIPPFDLALAVALTVLGQYEVWVADNGGSYTLRVVCMLLTTGSVTLRRRAPIAAAWIFMLGMVGEGISMDALNSLAELLSGLLIAYAVPRYEPVERAMRAVPALVLAIVVHRAASPGSQGVNDVIFDIAVVTMAWVLGAAARSRHLRAEDAERRAEEVERTRDLAEREAAAEERVRIARELHDIVAHALGVIAVQAGAAEAVMESDPAQARETVASIRERARESVTEMRRVLGLLREDSTNGREPQPTLDDVEALVGRVRGSGLDVDLQVEGQPRPLAPGVELSAFRIVQEALTNVTKHARADSAHVRLCYGSRTLEIEVIDDGRGPNSDAPESGYGLVGVRERVALLEGTLEAGPCESGGYRLRAELPLTEADR
jgi:signal transduction histidine kinase